MEKTPKDTIKRGFSDAEKEIREKQIKAVKELALKTLERIDNAKRMREQANTTIRILQRDLEDLKAGRLDRIEERQKKDPSAKEVSVALIERVVTKEVHHHHHDHYIIDKSRWYELWRITYNDSVSTIYSPIVGSTEPFMLTNSVSADYTGGAYTISTGLVVHI
uniref:Uncharacterized protein n=1 Tax=viral metagenome TaxID=1070528 RepID=A0A6M3LLW4_9ZZZZ